MSHFSTIKTKLTNEDHLLKALRVLQYPAYIDKRLQNPVDHRHEEVEVQVAVGKFGETGFQSSKIGFKWNGTEYDLIAELDAWDLDVPVQRFIDKITQQYAIASIETDTAKEGFTVESKVENVDGSVELVVSKW
tara:strand:+ start:290 stop:691 length:402 start_codon:yes stop_codon:yes gene_type:complete